MLVAIFVRSYIKIPINSHCEYKGQLKANYPYRRGIMQIGEK